MKKNSIQIAIVMGSDSDLPVMQAAGNILDEFGVTWQMRILSAHRTPEAAHKFAAAARQGGIKVIIAGAGGAAHLPGVLAAYTTLPVIGVPIQSAAFNGMDSLLSIVQMPSGIPVATVAVNGAKNAALLALQILSLSESGLAGRLEEYRQKLVEIGTAKDREIQRLGAAYLKKHKK